MNAFLESVMMMVGNPEGESSMAMVSARSSATLIFVQVVPYACGKAWRRTRSGIVGRSFQSLEVLSFLIAVITAAAAAWCGCVE